MLSGIIALLDVDSLRLYAFFSKFSDLMCHNLCPGRLKTVNAEKANAIVSILLQSYRRKLALWFVPLHAMALFIFVFFPNVSDMYSKPFSQVDSLSFINTSGFYGFCGFFVCMLNHLTSRKFSQLTLLSDYWKIWIW